MSNYAYERAQAGNSNNVVVKWPFQVLPYTSSEVTLFCVQDEKWQKFRKTLKGTPTFKKLEYLSIYRPEKPTRRHQVQIDNYINALRRGGQLNLKNEVVK